MERRLNRIMAYSLLMLLACFVFGVALLGPSQWRQLARCGVDRIKVMATERAGLPGTDPRIRIFNDEELAAVVNEAHKAGLWVVAHAHGDEGAAAAVRAGVHCIEHGTYLATTPFGL